MKQTNQSSSGRGKKLTHYELVRCPICYGKKIVNGGFYSSVGPYAISNTMFEECRQCKGQGMILINTQSGHIKRIL